MIFGITSETELIIPSDETGWRLAKQDGGVVTTGPVVVSGRPVVVSGGPVVVSGGLVVVSG